MKTFGIDDRYVLYKVQIKYVVPDEFTIIGDRAFTGCNQLEEIELPENLEYIGDSAFEKCISLKNITIPSSVKAIRSCAFSECSLLKDVKLPESLEWIYCWAFFECASLTEIIIPDNVSCIEGCAFLGCRQLKKVVLPKNLKKLYSDAFEDCPLESLTVHASYGDFGHYFINSIFKVRDNYGIPIFELIIKYDNYKELYNFVKIITQNNTLVKALNGWCNFNILFDGKKLNLLQQNIIKRLITKQYITNINLSFDVQDRDNKEEKLAIQEYNPKYKLSDEIKKLLEEINILSSKLPEEVKTTINQKISKLISDYEKGITAKNKRPTLSLEDEKISLEIKSMDPETVLLLSLNQMKLGFSSYDRLLEDISSVYKCRELLKTKVDNKPEKLNSLEEIIQAIIYLTNKIDERQTKYFITKVENTLSNALNKYNKDLDNLFGNNDNLLLLESPLTNQQLKIDLLKISDEITVYAQKVIPYIELLNALKSDIVTTYDNSNSITGTIIGMKYVLPFIINEKNRNQLEKEITSFCNEYINKIEKNIANIDNIKESDYQKLVTEISKRIHPILEKLNLYSNKDENEKDILTQLQNCISILNNTEFVEINEKKLLESWIGDLHNKLMNNDQMLEEEKQEINKKLLAIINKWLEKIDKMDNEEDMSVVMKVISSEIAEIYFKVDIFVKELDNYNKKNK